MISCSTKSGISRTQTHQYIWTGHPTMPTFTWKKLRRRFTLNVHYSLILDTGIQMTHSQCGPMGRILSWIIYIRNDHEPPIRFKYVMLKERIDFLDTTIFKSPLDTSQLMTSFLLTYRYTTVTTQSLVPPKTYVQGINKIPNHSLLSHLLKAS